MKSVQTAIAVFVILLLSFGCSDDKPTKQSETIYIKLGDVFTFNSTDTVELTMVNWSWTVAEPIIDYEYILNEPYTDVNGNGKYDNGVDGFIRSANQDINQDLNYNGSHEGPETPSSQWDGVLPYDDIDGNGEIRVTSWEVPSDSLAKYMPFLDCNRNGVWDESSELYRDVVNWYRYDHDADSEFYSSAIPHSYAWVSDSGLEYSLFAEPHYVPLRVTFQHETLLLSIVGLDMFFDLEDSVRVGTRYLDTLSIYPRLVVEKTATLDETFVIDDTTITGLTKILWRELVAADSSTVPRIWEFYFSEHLGLTGFEYRNGNQGDSLKMYRRPIRSADLPFPLTKVDRP